MGQSFYGVNLAKVVGSHAKSFGAVTLIRITEGARPSPHLPRAKTSTAYNAKGFVADYDDRMIDGSLIEIGDRKVVILAATLPSGIKPRTSDKVTVDSVVYRVGRVGSDPATAARYSPGTPSRGSPPTSP